MRFFSFRLFLPSLFVGLIALKGQIPDEKMEHRSSLGMQFVSITGTSSLLATHETRIADWQTFLSATGYPWTYKPHFDQGPGHPVVGITLADARAFCEWLTEKDRSEGRLNAGQTYRLPTRADWDAAIGLQRMRKPDLTVEEKFADERTFPWGMDWPPPAKVANLADGEIPGYEDGFPFTSPVGQFPPNAEGLYDLSGNVWEWCWDPEIRAEQVGVLRGGSWAYFNPDSLRSSYLYSVPVDLRMPTIGFRCVFEDKKRMAIMLATAEKIKSEIRTQRREEIIGGAVNKEDVAAMKERLTANIGSPNDEPVVVKPAVPGQPFVNDLGIRFIPLPTTSLLFGATEITVIQYESWLQEAGLTWQNKPSFLVNGEHPAVGITWGQATAFCAWLTNKNRSNQIIPANASYRLPTDLEWSQAADLQEETGADPAARGRSPALHYPWTPNTVFPPPITAVNLNADRIPGYQDGHSYTAPVSADTPNALGISGLGGNASEWCTDTWPESPDERVIRGGSWLSYEPEQLRTGVRQHFAADRSNNGIGFRIVLEMPTP